MKLEKYIKYYLYYKMTCEEFIEYVKNNKLCFISYCEIVIATDGMVLMPKSCGHIMMLQAIAEKLKIKPDKNKIGDELDIMLECTNAIAVWYQFSYCYNKKNLSIESMDTYNKLVEAGIIKGHLMNKKQVIL